MSNVITKNTTKTADSIVSREVRGEERELIKVPISSTRDDRDGDAMSKSALESMADQIQREQPLVHQNHGFVSFDKPLYPSEETIGTQVDAEVEPAKDADDEFDLNALVNPDLTHEEGERMLAQVKDGQAIKFSVGFRVLQAEEKDPEADNDDRRLFTDVDLMETSRVGIPANPDASAAVAAKSAHLAETLSAADVDIEDDTTFAKALAEALLRDGPVTSETVQHATPTAVDGDAQQTGRKETSDTADVEKGSCSADADCPDGEVCQDGKCVDADSVDAAADADADADGDRGGDTESYDMTNEERERLDQLEERVAALTETVDKIHAAVAPAEALADDVAAGADQQTATETDTAADQDAPDTADGATDDAVETFEVDGETYSVDDIRDLRDAAESEDVEAAETSAGTDTAAADAEGAAGTDTDTDGETSDATDTAASDSAADDGPTKSLREAVHR